MLKIFAAHSLNLKMFYQNNKVIFTLRFDF